MKTVRKIWDSVTTILVAVVVILAVLLVGARLVGFQVFTVLSGSMEPTYHTNCIWIISNNNAHFDYISLTVGICVDRKNIFTLNLYYEASAPPAGAFCLLFR